MTERLHILLIEDDNEDAFLIRRTLSESSAAHFSIDRVGRIEEALSALHETKYNVAVLDLTLPDSAGIETVELITNKFPSMPIVVVTDHRDLEIGRQAVRSGAQGFISKTEMTGTALAREIGHAIERQQFRHELAQHRDNLESLVAARTRELRDAVDRLEDHDRAKTEFIYNVSHELRTPLTSMIYTVGNILDGTAGDVTEKMHDYLNMLNDDCKRMKHTVEDILDLSRIDTQRLVMNCVSIQFNRFVEHVLSAFENSAAQRGVTFAYDNAMPPTFVSGDPDKLERTLFNLLQNALKYSAAGDQVDVHVGPDSDDATRIRCTVTDNGPGIPPEHLDHVTERYYRVGDHIDGTGLGLAIAKQIAEHHDGDLRLSSPPADRDHGTRASIGLPTTDAPTILVVDDEEIIQQVCRLYLTKTGYEVSTCSDGTEAFERLLNAAPDLLIVDLNMPQMGGASLISEVKASQELRQIPLIAITGGQVDKATDEILQGFAIPLLLKPWTNDQLVTMVENQLTSTHHT
jgi:signal transduction histidine kinase